MSARDFSLWLRTFRQSINGYDYYADFKKICENVENVKVEINILNSLVGSKNIEEEFKSILNKYEECLHVIPILLAVRGTTIFCQDENGAVEYQFDSKTQTVEQYAYFMKKTGLFEMMEKHIINNLYDYVTGVETGLDSNARKNRGGHQMEDLVESFLKETQVEYYKEMYLRDIEKKWNVDLSRISAEGTTEKRWDFVVKTKNKIFVIETNFYTSGGSKLNETARSYKMIAEEAKDISNFSFVWITDGGGWISARRNLEETFNVLDDLYNISDMENGIFSKLFL